MAKKKDTQVDKMARLADASRRYKRFMELYQSAIAIAAEFQQEATHELAVIHQLKRDLGLGDDNPGLDPISP